MPVVTALTGGRSMITSATGPSMSTWIALAKN
jgi:hypothetical protein